MERQGVDVESSVVYAGFWRRFAAFLIDALLISTVLGILYSVFVGLFAVVCMIANTGTIQSGEESSTAALVGFGVGFVVISLILVMCEIVISWLYFALMESSRRQATLGKMALRIAVTDVNGRRISFARATGRHFAKIISRIILYIGFILAGFTRKKQAMHDIITDCLVIKKG
ncbi:hypothetical protein ES703_57844 [subsurface metagenome]